MTLLIFSENYNFKSRQVPLVESAFSDWHVPHYGIIMRF